jgi:hypothetical protein
LRRAFVAAAIAFALVLASGCSPSSEAETGASETSAPTPQPTAPAPPPAPDATYPEGEPGPDDPPATELSAEPRTAHDRELADICSSGETGQGLAPGSLGPEPWVNDPVDTPKKRAWEEGLGGKEAARAHVRARLLGWPTRILADRTALPADDRAFLERVAQDTWRGIEAFSDRESGLPADHVHFAPGSVDGEPASVGDYAGITSIGLHLVAIVAAEELGLIPRERALEHVRRVLDTLGQLATFRGFHYNFYDTTSLEPTSHFVSFVDSAWLTVGLLVVRNAFPEVSDVATPLVDQMDYEFFYDPTLDLMSHGYYVDPGWRSRYHYGVLFAESRVGSLVAIGKGEAPERHWFTMIRTLPAECDWQELTPVARRMKLLRGVEFMGGCYEWGGERFVPSWGGSMFEALMPRLVLDEGALAPKSLGRNGEQHARVQRLYATEALRLPVWGMSPSAVPSPNGYVYGEHGVNVLGSWGYQPGIVTPHASALALAVTPGEATQNLRTLAERYDLYGEFGFYDAVDPRSGAVAYDYVSLDQSMLFIALANHLKDGCIQKRFAADPIVQAALPVIADEDFFEY